MVFFAVGDAKVLSFALGNAKLPDASSFASQWNIGLKPIFNKAIIGRIGTDNAISFAHGTFQIIVSPP